MNTEEEFSKVIRKKKETGEKLFKERRERMKNFDYGYDVWFAFSMLSVGLVDELFTLSVFSLFSECPFCGEVLF